MRLACLDLLEPIRPAVERCVLRLVALHRFHRRDFTETPDGHVWLLAPLTHELARTMPTRAEAVAPMPRPLSARSPILFYAGSRSEHRSPRPGARRTIQWCAQRAHANRGCPCRSRYVPVVAYGLNATTRLSVLPACLLAAKTGAASQAVQEAREAVGLPGPMRMPEARARLGYAIGRRDVEAPAWETAHPDVVADKASFAPIAAALGGVIGPAIARVTGMSNSYVAEVRLGG